MLLVTYKQYLFADWSNLSSNVYWTNCHDFLSGKNIVIIILWIAVKGYQEEGEKASIWKYSIAIVVKK